VGKFFVSVWKGGKIWKILVGAFGFGFDCGTGHYQKLSKK
jgi:hypothetical protein